jgi:hypothetical protein
MMVNNGYGIVNFYIGFNVQNLKEFRVEMKNYGCEVKIFGGLKLYNILDESVKINSAVMLVFTKDLSIFLSFHDIIITELKKKGLIPFGYFFLNNLYSLSKKGVILDVVSKLQTNLISNQWFSLYNIYILVSCLSYLVLNFKIYSYFIVNSK